MLNAPAAPPSSLLPSTLQIAVHKRNPSRSPSRSAPSSLAPMHSTPRGSAESFVGLSALLCPCRISCSSQRRIRSICIRRGVSTGRSIHTRWPSVLCGRSQELLQSSIQAGTSLPAVAAPLPPRSFQAASGRVAAASRWAQERNSLPVGCARCLPDLPEFWVKNKGGRAGEKHRWGHESRSRCFAPECSSRHFPREGGRQECATLSSAPC